MHGRFHTTYGGFQSYGADEAETPEVSDDTAAKKKGFQWTPEAQEGAVALIAAGTKLTQKAIEAKAKKKSKGKAKKKKAKAAPVAASEAPAGISTQTVLLGVGAFVLVGGAVWYASSQKKGQEAV